MNNQEKNFIKILSEYCSRYSKSFIFIENIQKEKEFGCKNDSLYEEENSQNCEGIIEGYDVFLEEKLKGPLPQQRTYNWIEIIIIL